MLRNWTSTRRRLAVGLLSVTVIVLVSSCEQPDGTNYGSTVIDG